MLAEIIVRYPDSMEANEARYMLGKTYIVLKYTMELEMIDQESMQRHIFALQEIADKLDTELAEKFGGSMQFEDWQKMDQSSVDNLLDNLFG